MAATELLDAASRAEGSALAAKDAETTIKNILGPNGDNPQGSLKFVNKDNSGATTKHLEGVTGDNDGWYIGSGSDGTNKGFLEIGVIDDGVVALLINSVKELTERVAYLESQLKG